MCINSSTNYMNPTFNHIISKLNSFDFDITNTNYVQQKLKHSKNRLIEMLEKYGSNELLANVCTFELICQSNNFHDPSNPYAENPFAAYALGLFLKYNNINYGEPEPHITNKFLKLLIDYIDLFKISMMKIDGEIFGPEAHVEFTSKLMKMLDDSNPNAFPKQSFEFYKYIFLPLNEYFMNKYGFTINFVFEFIDQLEKIIATRTNNKLQMIRNQYKKGKLNKKSNQLLFEKCSKPDTAIIFKNCIDLLTINPNTFYNENQLKNKNMLRNFLDTVCCRFGDQLQEFDDLLSDNIIFYKPIIKFNKDNYFVAKPDFLIQKLDQVLEYLLNSEKKSQSSVWNKFDKLKSEYAESFNFINRIFPKNCIFRNAHFYHNGISLEADLIVKYDNKIIIFESKSGRLPIYAKSDGRKKLTNRLENLVKKGVEQCVTVKEYIESNSTAIFWSDRSRKVPLLKIDNSVNTYEYYFIVSTLEHLSPINRDLNHINQFNYAEKGIYPLVLNMYDLDTITHIISQPIYFIHYIQQRTNYQKKGNVISMSELDLFSHYLCHGSLNENIATLQNGILVILPSTPDPIVEYYLNNKNCPRLNIPIKLEEILLEAQSQNQYTFTDGTNILLNLPKSDKEMISASITTIIKKSKKNRKFHYDIKLTTKSPKCGIIICGATELTKIINNSTNIHNSNKKLNPFIKHWFLISIVLPIRKKRSSFLKILS